MSRSIRRAMIDRDHQQLSLVRQCILLDVSRASVYYRPVPTRAEDLELMALMDRQYLKTPFYGSRKMKAWLLQQGYLVSRKRVRRLMRLMGLEAIYRRPNTSKPAPGHRIFPYLLKGVEVNRVDQVWAADITYIPMAKGFLYLVAIMDWHSRHVLAWKLSNTMDCEGRRDNVPPGRSSAEVWRLKTVPPVAFNQERQNLIEGGLDVQGGDVPASSQGLLCRRDERSRGCAGIRTAPGHGAQDAQVLGTSRVSTRPTA